MRHGGRQRRPLGRRHSAHWRISTRGRATVPAAGHCHRRHTGKADPVRTRAARPHGTARAGPLCERRTAASALYSPRCPSWARGRWPLQLGINGKYSGCCSGARCAAQAGLELTAIFLPHHARPGGGILKLEIKSNSQERRVTPRRKISFFIKEI